MLKSIAKGLPGTARRAPADSELQEVVTGTQGQPVELQRGPQLSAQLTLQELIARTPVCFLQPLTFFVSWQGVLTLAYRGFPPALLKLKTEINSTHAELPQENPGAKWPKTSLAAVKDGKRLTPLQLETLNSICREQQVFFQRFEPEMTQLQVDQLSIVLFRCRSLERVVSLQDVPLSNEAEDGSPPAAQEQERVRLIVGEASAPDYWFHASKDGNRASHYTDTHLGATLVHRLTCCQPPSAAGTNGRVVPGALLPHIIQKFRERVDRELPGMYSWFPLESLHVTLRGLMG